MLNIGPNDTSSVVQACSHRFHPQRSLLGRIEPVTIHFILYSTTLLDFTDIFFLHTYLYYLLIHAYSSTYSCTVRVAMHSPRSHAQFAHPCTVRASMHSSCSLAQFLHSPHTAMHSSCLLVYKPLCN